MNVVVLGAGTVGTSIAELLCQREDSVTVVDIDPKQTAAINEKLDVRALNGSASQSSVLFQAGISTADVCLAVTGSDETNIVGASLAKAMGCRRSIARVYAPVFRDLSTFEYQEHFQIDRILSLEHLTAMALARAVRDPGSVVVEQFSRGGLAVNEVTIGKESSITAVSIAELSLPSGIRIGTIQRDKLMWIASANDQLQVGDKVIVFSRSEDNKVVRSLFGMANGRKGRIVIAGGGETGFHLARLLEHENFKITILEADAERSQRLASDLSAASVIECDAAIRENLEEERVGNADVFAACTGDDEDNLMLAVEAKELGARQVLCLMERADYSNIVDKLGIDLAVSQRDVMANRVLSFLTEGAVVSRSKLPGGLINIIELEVEANAPICGLPLAEAGLPKRCLVVSVMKPGFVRLPTAEDVLQSGDHLVMLVEDDVVETALARFQG
ncbi:MAG: Trk system potassium transporter TrkA [Mariniblastus sp.]|nr:Trk system potassium transporter TrkA [Mariniblastus sp.]